MKLETLSLYVLKTLALAQFQGRFATLDTVTREVGARRTDVRRVVSALHRAGYVDALRMRLTLAGFAAGAALRSAPLPPLRAARMSSVVAA